MLKKCVYLNLWYLYVNIVLADYLAASDDKMKGLMSRHRTLSDSNVHLVNNLESMADEVC